ncbi:MAG: hypothetical protein JRL30_21855 [Deltaproteobacteria bacterium]|nr:hypothetical protein [Deltaproteobacteria bacterium]
MKANVDRQVDSWIIAEEIPPPANLRAVSRFDGLYPEDEGELEAYWDFIRWTMAQEHLLLQSIPKPKNEHDFWHVELDEFGDNVSAFNTMDFERMHPFDKYAYRLKKIYERVQDLALLFSCISHDEGKKNTRERFKNLVENEFRDRAIMLLETLRKYGVWVNKDRCREEIEELNKRIRKCNKIWQRYAYQD